MLQGAIVKSGVRQVIPVMPEEICAQDGEEKEDCETDAFKRFFVKFRKEHDKLGILTPQLNTRLKQRIVHL